MRKIIYMTTDSGGDSEDYNPFYSRFYIVEGGDFSEEIFKPRDSFGTVSCKQGEDQWIEDVKALGYTVELHGPIFVVDDYDEDEDYEEEE